MHSNRTKQKQKRNPQVILAYQSLSPTVHKKGSGKRISITLETYAELVHLLSSDETLKF